MAGARLHPGSCPFSMRLSISQQVIPCLLRAKHSSRPFIVVGLHLQPKLVVPRGREVIWKEQGQVSALPFTSCQFNLTLRTSISSPVKCE